jgi:RNA polymerase sigma-70 factor (ECF subfamily)
VSVTLNPEQVFDQYHQAVYDFAYRMIQRADIAEDVTQECFLALLRRPEKFDPRAGTMKTYLFGIARNLALKRFRDERTEPLLDDEAADGFDRAASMPIARAVEQAISSLPELQREAVILFEYEGCTLEEIAAISGTDTGAVKSRLHRARENLRRTLAPVRKIGDRCGSAGTG